MKFTAVNGDGEIYARCPYTSLPLNGKAFPFANEAYFSVEAALRHQASKKEIDLDTPLSAEDLAKVQLIARSILSVVNGTPAKDQTNELVEDLIQDSMDFYIEYVPPAPTSIRGLVPVEKLHREHLAKKEEKEKKKSEESGDESEKNTIDMHFYHLTAGAVQAVHFSIPRGGPIEETMDEDDEVIVENLSASAGFHVATIDNKTQPPVLVFRLSSEDPATLRDNFLLSEVIPSFPDTKGDFLVVSSKNINEFLTKRTEKKANKRAREEKKSNKLKEKAERAQQREARKLERTKELLAKEERKAQRAAAKAAKEAAGETSKPRNRKAEGANKKQKTSSTSSSTD